jgi:hypothetical protein
MGTLLITNILLTGILFVLICICWIGVAFLMHGLTEVNVTLRESNHHLEELRRDVIDIKDNTGSILLNQD